MNPTTAFWLGVLVGGVIGATLGVLLYAVVANRRIHEAQDRMESYRRLLRGMMGGYVNDDDRIAQDAARRRAGGDNA